MNISLTGNGKKLEIALEGRLDTMTAPELEDVLGKSLDSADSLTLDLGRLEFISSAGLRVLLSAHKEMSCRNGMKLKNVNSVIREVFTVTGFANMLTIE